MSNVIKPCPFLVGQCYLIRTVTMFWVGRVVKIVGDFLVLGKASWIADTGRYHQADCTENLSKIEPVKNGNVFVGLNTIIDAREWKTDLPKDVK